MVALQTKIGQMLIMGFPGTDLADAPSIQQALVHQCLGGVILFSKNIESPSQVRTLNADLHAMNGKNNPWPLWIAVDYEGGAVNRLPQTKGFPETFSAKMIGEMTDQQIAAAANKMANTLIDHGFNFDFAPVVDLDIEPLNPVITKWGRAFSHLPERVAHVAGLFATAFEKQHLFYSYKHFPGHGSSTEDSHEGLADVTRTWRPEEVTPYEILLAQASPFTTVMLAHVVHAGLDPSETPLSLSRPIIQGWLREKLGFEGLLICDDLQMDAVAAHYPFDQALAMAINAGNDLLIIGNNLGGKKWTPQEVVARIEAGVASGQISAERIDEAFERIQKSKSAIQKLG